MYVSINTQNSIRHYLSLFAFLFVFVGFQSCSDDDDDGDVFQCTDFEWSYEDDSAPEFWSQCFMTCSGESQSPINIAMTEPDTSLMALVTNYEDSPIELLNNGHTIEFEYGEGSNLVLNGEDFNLLQFHFHTPSEHTLNGEHLPMEIHMVHRKSDTELAVISILVQEGAENAALKSFSDELPEDENDVYEDEDTFNAADLLPSETSYYTYGGSLTTPPCSETVTWFIMQTPIEASAEQIDNFSEILDDNNRPVRPLNGRDITSFD